MISANADKALTIQFRSEISKSQLCDSIRRLSSWLEKNEYRGYDTFDGLSARFLRPLTFNNKLLRIAVEIQRLPSHLENERPLQTGQWRRRALRHRHRNAHRHRGGDLARRGSDRGPRQFLRRQRQRAARKLHPHPTRRRDDRKVSAVDASRGARQGRSPGGPGASDRSEWQHGRNWWTPPTLRRPAVRPEPSAERQRTAVRPNLACHVQEHSPARLRSGAEPSLSSRERSGPSATRALTRKTRTDRPS